MLSGVKFLVPYMLMLRAERRTGVLTARGGERSTSLHHREGALVFAEEDAQGETLGRMLVRQNLLTHDEYNLLITKMSDALVIHEALRFGELAVTLGFLTQAQVEKALADQVRWKVMRLLQRRDEVTWEFSATAATAPAVATFSVDLEELVLEAVRWIDDDQKSDLGLFAILGQKLGVRDEKRADVARRFSLSRAEAEFLQNLDGKRSIGELIASAGSVIDAPALLTALLLTRTLEPLDVPSAMPVAPPSAAPRSANAPATSASSKASSPSQFASSPAPAPRSAPAAPTSMGFTALAAPISQPPALTSDIPKAPALPGAARGATPNDPRRDPWWNSTPSSFAPMTPPNGARVSSPAVATARTLAAPKPSASPPPASSRMPTTSATPSSASFRAAPPSSSAMPRANSSAGFPAQVATPPASSAMPRANSSAGFPAPHPSSSSMPRANSSAGFPAVNGSAPQSSRASAVLKALESRRVPPPSERVPTSPHEAKLLAEREFQAALEHYKAFRYADANPGFSRAAQLMPESTEYRLYATWNSIQNNGGPTHRHDRGEAWRLATKAIAADPNFAFGHYVAGAVAHEDSKWAIAFQFLTRAVKLDADLLDAQRRLRIVSRYATEK